MGFFGTCLGHTTRLTATTIALGLLLGGCTGSETSTPSGSAAPAPDNPLTKAMFKIEFPNTPDELRAALPTAYGKALFVQESGARGNGGVREDPLANRTVEPESCRELMRAGGRTDATFAQFPMLPYATAYSAAEELTVDLISLPAPYADQYLDLIAEPAPHCTNMLVDGNDPASIVEHPIAGLGGRARYIERTYQAGGSAHRQQLIYFTTPTYFAAVRTADPGFTSTNLETFARQVQTLADSKLRG